MKQHALEHFRRPPKLLNCAQSVLHAYQTVYGSTTISLADLKPLGGGRSPGGLCGALHAACALVPDKAETLKRRFAEKAGSTVCRELRRANRYACEDCVSHAAELLQAELASPASVKT
jgi:hypothetical protein